jgi:hypothetical protein
MPCGGDDAAALQAAIITNTKAYLVRAMELQAPCNYEFSSVLAVGADATHGGLTGLRIFAPSRGCALNQNMTNAPAIVSWGQYGNGDGCGLDGPWLHGNVASNVAAGVLITTQAAARLHFERLQIDNVNTAFVQQGLTGANGDQLTIRDCSVYGSTPNFMRWETGVNQAVAPVIRDCGGFLNPGGVIFDWQAYAATGLVASGLSFSQNNGIVETGHAPYPCSNSTFIRWTNAQDAQAPVTITGGRCEWVSNVMTISDNGQGGSVMNPWEIAGIEFTHCWRTGNAAQLGLGALSFSGQYAGSHAVEFRNCKFVAVDNDLALSFPIYLDPAAKRAPILVFRNCHWIGPANFKPAIAANGASFAPIYEHCTFNGVLM